AGPVVFRLPFQERSGHAGLPRAGRDVADGRLLPRLERRAGGGARGGGARARALGLGELKFSGQVLPNARKVVYNIDMKRVMRSKLVLGVADGWLSMDGEI